jgi:UDP-glucose 4-epimerase
MLSRGTGLGFTTLRVSNPFGPGQTAHKGQGLIPTILKQYAAGAPVKIFGDGKSERDYIYIEDVVDAIVTCLQRGPFNGAVNIGSGRGRTILEVVEAVERALGRNIDRQYIESRPTDTPSNVLDISKAKTLLDWAPRTDFHEAIRLTVDAYPLDHR